MGYTFGPVASRRLGRSLGVDLIPFKTCPFDCLYCEVGRTTLKTLDRREWVPLDAVLAEIRERLDTQPDFITLGGSGEPTLYSRLGELVAGIKTMTSIPVAVLTNSALLWMAEVREALAKTDVVLPSLDAGNEAAFLRVNRPASSTSFELMLNGLIDFRKRFKGQIWLEVLLLAGITDSDQEVAALADAVKAIRPHRVQLNTVTRPPAYGTARPVSRERLEVLAQRFTPPAEIIADYRAANTAAASGARGDDVLAMLRRRPCRATDVAAGMALSLPEAQAFLDSLVARGLATPREMREGVFYTAVEPMSPNRASHSSS